MAFYGILHHHGSFSSSHNIYAFDSKAARDEWEARGPSFLGDSGAREAVYAADPRVRRAKGRIEGVLTEDEATDENGTTMRIVSPY